MKKFFALCLAFSTLAVLPLAGCGGGSTPPDVSTRATAALSPSNDNRGIQVSWSPQFSGSERYTVIEYHVVRQSAASPDRQTLVGVTSPTQTIFMDTTQERSIRINTPSYTTLTQSTEVVPGLTAGTYTYSIYTLYRDNTVTRMTPPVTLPRLYDFSTGIKDTTPVRFDE